jgi:hypothetical protein
MSMLHNTSHKLLFRPRFAVLNMVIPYVLCLFFGQTWNTYFFHHVKHHHVEDNGSGDLSSTESFQRDSLAHFLFYFVRFFMFIQMELPYYFFSRGQYMTALKTLSGELLTFTFYAVMLWNWPRAALAVFVVPFLLMRFFMMAANWGQHAFINHRAKDAHSLTIIHSSYNLLAFNDGFHASHHENSQRHWSEHPAAAISKIDASLENITLSGDVNFGDVWVLLMTKNYNQLEKMVPKEMMVCAFRCFEKFV